MARLLTATSAATQATPPRSSQHRPPPDPPLLAGAVHTVALATSPGEVVASASSPPVVNQSSRSARRDPRARRSRARRRRTARGSRAPHRGEGEAPSRLHRRRGLSTGRWGCGSAGSLGITGSAARAWGRHSPAAPARRRPAACHRGSPHRLVVAARRRDPAAERDLPGGGSVEERALVSGSVAAFGSPPPSASIHGASLEALATALLAATALAQQSVHQRRSTATPPSGATTSLERDRRPRRHLGGSAQREDPHPVDPRRGLEGRRAGRAGQRDRERAPHSSTFSPSTASSGSPVSARRSR